MGPQTTWWADLVQINDAHDTMSSVGFIHDFKNNFLVEGWASFPSVSGSRQTFILKVDYVIRILSGI
ncbi:MAG: hypothetical protein IT210_06355 [Armatimonadetes bacterium]|nr:hypothetical protein [Armatimonadota bacterium]